MTRGAPASWRHAPPPLVRLVLLSFALSGNGCCAAFVHGGLRRQLQHHRHRSGRYKIGVLYPGSTLVASSCTEDVSTAFIRNIFIRIKCWLLRRPCPWEEAPEEASEGDDAFELERATDLPNGGRRASSSAAAAAYEDGMLSPETAAEKAAREEASDDVFTKRLLVSAGIIGTGITWVLFVWFTFTYGLLIYNTLGAKAQDSFVNRYCGLFCRSRVLVL